MEVTKDSDGKVNVDKILRQAEQQMDEELERHQ